MAGMRYDAPGAFAMPGGGVGVGGLGNEAFNNLKWHRQLYLGLKDLGVQGLRTGKVSCPLYFPRQFEMTLSAHKYRVLERSVQCSH